MVTAFRAETFQRAIDRAHEMGGASIVSQAGADKYSVLSSSGHNFYSVTVARDGAAYVCNCAAGQKGIPCKHAACVWLYRVGQSMKRAGP
jgi:hypothetical protein